MCIRNHLIQCQLGHSVIVIVDKVLRIESKLPRIKIPSVGVLALGKFLVVFLAGDLCPMFGGGLLVDVLLQLILEDELKVCPRLGGQGLECLPSIFAC